MRSETVGLRTRPVSDQEIGLRLRLGLAGLVLCSETRSCHARRHNDLEGRSNFSSAVYSFTLYHTGPHICTKQGPLICITQCPPH